MQNKQFVLMKTRLDNYIYRKIVSVHQHLTKSTLISLLISESALNWPA